VPTVPGIHPSEFAIFSVPTPIIISFASLSLLLRSYRFRRARDGQLSQDFIHHLCASHRSRPLQRSHSMKFPSTPPFQRCERTNQRRGQLLTRIEIFVDALNASLLSTLSIISFRLNEFRNTMHFRRSRRCTKPTCPPKLQLTISRYGCSLRGKLNAQEMRTDKVRFKI
jgi:hypothetical protein